MDLRDLRIGFLSTQFNSAWGGSEELWAGAVSHLLRRGVAVSVVASESTTCQPNYVALRGAGAELLLWRQPSPLRWWHRIGVRLGWPPPRQPWPAEMLALRKPRLAVVSLSSPALSADLWQPFKAASIPYVIIVQVASETLWPRDWDLPAYRDGLLCAKAVFFVSEANRRLFREQVGVECAITEVVKNPFLVPYETEAQWPDQRVQKLAFVGRLDPVSKGCDVLLKTLALPKWKQRNVECDLIGDGSCRKGMEQLAETLALHNVRFLPHTEDIAGVWRDHHALVLPSRFEGLPLALIEAMLCGRVPIVTDVGGNAELVEDNSTGFISAAPTVQHFDDALERAWARRHDWREIGQRAGIAVRKIVPPDPAGVFAQRLLELCGA